MIKIFKYEIWYEGAVVLSKNKLMKNSTCNSKIKRNDVLVE